MAKSQLREAKSKSKSISKSKYKIFWACPRISIRLSPNRHMPLGVGCYVTSPRPDCSPSGLAGLRAFHWACPERRMPIRGPLTQIVR